MSSSAKCPGLPRIQHRGRSNRNYLLDAGVKLRLKATLLRGSYIDLVAREAVRASLLKALGAV